MSCSTIAEAYVTLYPDFKECACVVLTCTTGMVTVVLAAKYFSSRAAVLYVVLNARNGILHAITTTAVIDRHTNID
jgi:hypothetical protein